MMQHDVFKFFIYRREDNPSRTNPWLVALVPKNGNKAPFCSGTLISPRHVLTAASCLTMTGEETDIQVAPLVSSWPIKPENQPYYNVGSVHIYKGADSTSSEEDIALLQLSPIEQGVPTCLGDQTVVRDVAKGDIVTVAGWTSGIKVIQ